MRNLSFKMLLLLTVVALVGLAACDITGEQNITWKPGTSLRINGSSEVEVGATELYFVQGYTTEETFTWTLDGETVAENGETAWLVDRGVATGEYIGVQFDTSAAGSHTITVSNGTYEGSLDVTAVVPEE